MRRILITPWLLLGSALHAETPARPVTTPASKVDAGPSANANVAPSAASSPNTNSNSNSSSNSSSNSNAAPLIGPMPAGEDEAASSESKSDPKAEGKTGPKSDAKVKDASKKPKTDYDRALEHAAAGRLKEAAATLRSITGDDAEKARASLLLGTLYFERKKLKKARKYFDAAEDAPLAAETAYAYGAAYLKSEEYTKALRGFRSNIKLKGKNRNLSLYGIGVAYFKQGQYARSERFFEAVSTKTLNKGLKLDRQRYLAEIRQRHDEILSTFMGSENEVNSIESGTRESKGSDDDWSSSTVTSTNWDIKWKPGAMLKQESLQSLNQGNGRDVSDTLSHKVGFKAFAGGDPTAKMFGSFDFGMGFAGYDVRFEQSRSFTIPGISGEFLSEMKKEYSEENLFLNIKPMLNFEVTSNVRGEAGVSYTSFLPHFQAEESWGQSEAFSRFRIEGKELDGGFEIAMQQAFDNEKKTDTTDTLIKADINQRLGDLTLRLNGQTWNAGNEKFVAFDRSRMSLLDSRFRYHLGFKSETKMGVSGVMSFGDISLRASYDFTTRSAGKDIERLSAVNDPETVSKQSNKRMFAVSLPVWDTIGLSMAAGTQNLSNYVYSAYDETSGALLKRYETDAVQTLVQLGVGISLVDWIKIRINYSIGKTEYKSEDAKDAAFLKSNPRASESSVMFVELSKSL